jgi:hypothetical protein
MRDRLRCLFFPWRPDVRAVGGGLGSPSVYEFHQKNLANGNSKNRERPTAESTFGQ